MKIRSILYHDVVERSFDESGFPGLAAARYKLWRAEFDEHLDAIASRSVSPPVALAALPHTSSGGPTPLLFTIDDGGVSASYIADRLADRGWRGVFFITTDRIGDPAFVSPADLRRLHADGHTIGSHTCSHPFRMSELPPERMEAEWANSIAKLRDILGAPVDSASVPAGFYAPAVAIAAGKAGIRWLFTSEPTSATHEHGGCCILGRYSVYRGMSSRYAADLASGRPLAIAGQTALWKSKKAAKTFAGPVWDRARRRIFNLK
jgi:peptidoglycan/xylan/chitin deacetylase (PgdA/CDA1 family)